MLNLPIMYRRDLNRLVALPAEELLAAARAGRPIYGFVILATRCSPGGSLRAITVTRSGVALDVERNGRMVPAKQRKVG